MILQIMKKLLIKDMHAVARKHEGKYLSSDYLNSSTKTLWECKLGHQWEAKPNDIRNGHWCPKCAIILRGNKKRNSIEKYIKIAEEKGGKLVSQNYSNNHTKLLWKCKKGHTWKNTPKHIQRGQWCPICNGTPKKTLNEIKNFAKIKNGICLSKEYRSNKELLTWQCLKGHIWKASWHTVQSGGHWCPECGGSKKKIIKDMHNLAESRGGKCLSNSYENNKFKLSWQCKLGHEWKAKPNCIISGTWCPICSTGVSERICRQYFEGIFGKKFPKGRPKWLKSKKGFQMELDGYCKEQKIAFEYNGEQHYNEVAHFSGNYTLKQRKEYDVWKENLCNIHGITLFTIPYTINFDRMKDYICKICSKKDVNIPIFDENIHHSQFDLHPPNQLNELQKLAQSKGGKCLSTRYTHNRIKLKWQCEKGHIWKAIPYSIKFGKWCPVCARNRKRT